jgi:hypothetical protein
MFVGQWFEWDKQDSAYPPNSWTVRVEVLGQVTYNAKQYFHIRQQNFDPYSDPPTPDREFYVRSTTTSVYFYNPTTHTEYEFFRKGGVGDSWTYWEGGQLKAKAIMAIENISVPYGPAGGSYLAYKHRWHNVGDPGNYVDQWVVPGLGLVQEQDYWLDDPSREPATSPLSKVGASPVSPLRTGMTLTYDSSNGTDNWNMTVRVLGTVSLGGRTYYDCLRSNYYSPTSGDEHIYIRSDDRHVYGYDSYYGDYIAAQVGVAGSPPIGQTWTGGSLTYRIDDIAEVTANGNNYQAYKIHYPFPSAYPTFDYLVPGVGIVKTEITTIGGTIAHTLASISRPYAEDFESGKATGWRSNNPSCWRVIFPAGPGNHAYRAASPSTMKQMSMVSTYTGAVWSNFTLQARVKQQKVRHYGYATYLIFRASANFSADSGGAKKDSLGSGYAFGIDDGNPLVPGPCFCIFKIVNGRLTILTNPANPKKVWMPTTNFTTTTDWNTLKVEAQGSTLNFYINNMAAPVASITDTSLTGGRIGFLGYTDRYSPTAHLFDDVSVETLP